MKSRFFKKTAALLLSALMLTACSSQESNDAGELLEAANAKLDCVVAQHMDLSKTVVLNASVVPSFEELGFDVDGYIYGIYAEPGVEVEEGEVLATLVSKNYEEMESLKDEIAKLKKSNEERFKKIDADMELARLAGESSTEKELEAKHEKELAQLQLQLKEERLAQLESEDIGYHYILAPRDAMAIAAIPAREGTFVKAGSSVVALESDGEVMITCSYISEKSYKNLYDIYAISDGERIELEYLPYTKQELKNLSTNGISPVSRFRIKDGRAKDFIAGDSMTVIAVSDFKENVLAIPSNSIYSDSTGRFVYVIENDNRIRKNIVTGISDTTYTEIVEGLTEGEMVYVRN